MNKEIKEQDQDMLAKVLRISLLYDFYSPLLTSRQQQVLEMHYLQDLSLGEIADEFAISRQAVHDMLRRAEQLLTDYETKLALVARHRCQQQILQQVHTLLTGLQEPVRSLPSIGAALGEIEQLLQESTVEYTPEV